MRYRELLESDMSVDEFRELLDKCTIALNNYKTTGRCLYRGTKKDDCVFLGTSPEGRKPRDTDIEIHKAVDIWLKDHGFIARRSNSIFVTGRSVEAEFYGNLFIVVPFDGFSFTWWEKVPDMTTHLDDIATMRNYDDQQFRNYFQQNIDSIMGELVPRKDDFNSAIKSRNEIMIHGDYLLVRDEGYNPYREIVRELTGV